MTTIICGNKTFSNIRAIFFDKDGTLEDSRVFLHQLARERVNLIAAKISGIEELLLKALGITSQGIQATGLMAVGSRKENELAVAAYIATSGCGWFVAKKIAEEAFEEAEKNIIPTVESSPMFSATLELIQELVTANLKLGIISADSTKGVENFVKREQISPYLSILLGSDRDLQKPDPKLYLHACKLLAVKPHQTLMVGDSSGDIMMAKQAGAGGSIGICRENCFPEHLVQADVVIDDWKKIRILESSRDYLIV